MFAAVANRAARERQAAGAASTTAVVAVPTKMPADRPDRTRPTSRVPVFSAIRKTTSLVMAAARPASRSGRRPSVSDQRPNASSAAKTPKAYIAKITVDIVIEKPNRSW